MSDKKLSIIKGMKKNLIYFLFLFAALLFLSSCASDYRRGYYGEQHYQYGAHGRYGGEYYPGYDYNYSQIRLYQTEPIYRDRPSHRKHDKAHGRKSDKAHGHVHEKKEGHKKSHKHSEKFGHSKKDSRKGHQYGHHRDSGSHGHHGGGYGHHSGGGHGVQHNK